MVKPVPQNPSNSPRSPDDSGIADLAESSDADIYRRLGAGISFRGENEHQSSSNERTVSEDGASLYRRFLDDEFRRRNLPEPRELLPQESPYHRMNEPTSSDLIRAGNQLRLLSDEFSQSPMRQWVEDQAARVPLDNMDFNAFSELLYGLFQEGGVTWERMVVLFYFCTDLAARSLREKLPQHFQNIVAWSFRFFTGERLATWVTENGGWINVLNKSVSHFYQVVKFGFILIGIFAFASYVWKS